jgi:peptidoglycan hydrolase-like protein with peptidoglycan-binding domain
MSEADRRQIQQMLLGMKFYQGPIDGKFGPLTRAAIRRFQDSIGVKSTGYLTAEQATRLASTR